jgi:hypothetical protein
MSFLIWLLLVIAGTVLGIVDRWRWRHGDPLKRPEDPQPPPDAARIIRELAAKHD